MKNTLVNKNLFSYNLWIIYNINWRFDSKNNVKSRFQNKCINVSNPFNTTFGKIYQVI